MHALVDDFLQYLRTERGQSENTQKTYAALLGRFISWAEKRQLNDWHDVEFKHLTGFLQDERERELLNSKQIASAPSPPLEERAGERRPITPRTNRKLSSESLYLQ